MNAEGWLRRKGLQSLLLSGLVWPGLGARSPSAWARSAQVPDPARPAPLALLARAQQL